MTAWYNLVANSALAEGDGDAWEHLINPSGIGGGETIILPVDSIMVDAPSHAHTIELDDRDISINISKKKYTVDITNDVFIAMENNDKEVNNACS